MDTKNFVGDVCFRVDGVTHAAMQSMGLQEKRCLLYNAVSDFMVANNFAPMSIAAPFNVMQPPFVNAPFLYGPDEPHILFIVGVEFGRIPACAVTMKISITEFLIRALRAWVKKSNSRSID